MARKHSYNNLKKYQERKKRLLSCSFPQTTRTMGMMKIVSLATLLVSLSPQVPALRHTQNFFLCLFRSVLLLGLDLSRSVLLQLSC